MQRYRIIGKIKKQTKVSSFDGYGFVHNFQIFYPEPYSTFDFINLTDCEPCFNASKDDCVLMQSIEKADKPKRGRKKK